MQVNWYRGPKEPADNPCWDSHIDEPNRLRNVLVPPTDQAFAALLDDLTQRGMLDETLVVCMAEFGRTPRSTAGPGAITGAACSASRSPGEGFAAARCTAPATRRVPNRARAGCALKT